LWPWPSLQLNQIKTLQSLQPLIGFCLCRVAGFRVAEYSQTTQYKGDEHEYASRNKVVKAFIASDWMFYDQQGHLVVIHSLDGLANPPQKMKLTFRIQKNRQNGQSITFVVNDKHQHICPVCTAYRTYLQAKCVSQFNDQPVGFFVYHHCLVKYLTANKIADVLQSNAKECHPYLKRDELIRFTSHLGRVWAVVLLDEAGTNPDFIKS
jgi:hypothetical protein